MENTTGSAHDRDVARRHLVAARVALQALDAMTTPEGVTLSGRIVAQHLDVAMKELNDIDQEILFDSRTTADSPRVACAFCGKMIVSTATLCGFCWRKRSEPATAATEIQK
jgi:hypothetical protein